MCWIYTGEEFNRMNRNKKLIKLTNKFCSHRGFKYKKGLNVDKYKLVFGKNKGGFCFTDMLNISKWLKYYFYKMKYCWDIVIPDDATIHIYPDYYKSNKFILSNKRNIKDLKCWNNMKFCKYVVKQNPYAIKYVKIQTPDMCMSAVKHRGYLLKYIKIKTYDICLEAVKQYGMSLEYVSEKFKNERLCIEAVKKTGYALKFVPKNIQTIRICISAVQNAVLAYTYVNQEHRHACNPAIRMNNLEHKYDTPIKTHMHQHKYIQIQHKHIRQ